MALKCNFVLFNFFILQVVLIVPLVECQSQDKNFNADGAAGNDTSKWEAPSRVQELFPYYISGFDEEGRPIVTLNFGRWDFRSFLEEDGSNFEILNKYIQQLVHQSHNSPKNYEQSRSINQLIIMANLDGYDLRQLSHLPSLRLTLSFARNLFVEERQEARLYKGIAVNANFFFQSMWSLAKPILGNLGNLFEIYGTNSDEWKPKVFRQVPRSQLPEWLGGFSNHTNVQVWG